MLAVVVVPVVALTTAVRLDSLAPEAREAGLALGLTRSQLSRSVLLPHARPAVLTSPLLGLARAAGETAPLLFTATVFQLAQDAADTQAIGAAWGSALVLVVLAGLLLPAALPARRRLERP